MTLEPRRNLRQLHAEQTRDLILQAYVRCLEERETDDISVQDIAQEAGISARTVYRHFPTRVDLLAGLAGWTRDHFLSLLPLADLDHLPGVIATAVEAFDARPALGRALARTSLGRDVISGLSADIRQQVGAVIDRDLAGLPAAARQRVLGALICVDSVQSWLVLREEIGMGPAEISDTLGWAVRALVEAARRELPSESPHEPRPGRDPDASRRDR